MDHTNVADIILKTMSTNLLICCQSKDHSTYVVSEMTVKVSFVNVLVNLITY